MGLGRTLPYSWQRKASKSPRSTSGRLPMSLVCRILYPWLEISNPFPGPTITHYTCDITSASSVSETAGIIRSTFGDPTILINNAGIATGLTVLSSTDESVQKTFAVNTFAHFRLVREFLPAMVSANHGTVVNVASIAAAVSTANIVDYSCSKSAALAFHEGLAVELKLLYKAPKVRTIAVCPSYTQTSLTGQLQELKDKFVMPMQKVETVAEKVVEQILSGNSGVVVVSCRNSDISRGIHGLSVSETAPFQLLSPSITYTSPIFLHVP